MGLQERKWQQSIQKEYMPEYQADLNQVVEKEIPFEIDWASFENDLNSIKFIPSVCLHRFVNAFKELCKDTFAKEAIQDSVEKIYVKNIPSENAENKKALHLEGGVLTMQASYGGHYSGVFTELAIIEFLENSL